MNRYRKDTAGLMIKFVTESNNQTVAEVPTTDLEMHRFLKADYITFVLRNACGDRLITIGNVIVVIERKYVLTQTGKGGNGLNKEGLI